MVLLALLLRLPASFQVLGRLAKPSSAFLFDALSIYTYVRGKRVTFLLARNHRLFALHPLAVRRPTFKYHTAHLLRR
ncbi:hypothetical protein C8J57DRAFT_1272966 [Mycena rebaudengoi]|nr:hypothetical protein C8J57DRAFT_1272966 [Mycena rebaudengoi]